MITTLLLQKIVELLLMLLMGYALVKTGVLRTDDSMILSKLSLYLFSPCTIVMAFQVEYDAALLGKLGFSALLSLLIHLFLFLFAGGLRKVLKLDTVEEASVIYSNAGNLVIPLVSYVLGEEWVIYCSAFLAVQLFFLWTHGEYLFQKGAGFQWKKILLNINLLAIAAGFLLMILRIRLPQILGETFQSMGDMLGPAAMLITGMLAAGISLRKVLQNRRIYLVAVLRLLVVPGCLLLVLKGLMAAGVIAHGSYQILVTFFAVMTPAASTITQLAQIHNRNASYAGAINIVTTLGCMITMPILVWLYLL